MENYNIEPYNENSKQQNHEQEEAYLRAKKKVEKIVGFYWHLASYIIINAFILYFIYINTESGFWSFGTFSTVIFWGIGLFFHFLGAFGPGFMFGKNWEERQIKKFMDEDKKRWE